MTKADKLKAKQAKRRSLIESMRRSLQFAVDYTPELQDQVPDRLARLVKCWECFQSIHEECEELDESENATRSNDDILAQTEDLFFETKAALSKLVKKEKEEQPRSKLVSVKLPTISLPVFSGEVTQWLLFHDTFVSLVHNCDDIAPIQKFHYLRASLKGEAAGIVHPIPISSENYTVAWKALLDRYGNKPYLRKMHTRELFGLPSMINSGAQELRQLVSKFQLHIDILKQLGETVSDDSSIIMEILASKLDKASLKAWEEHYAQEEALLTYPSMTAFLLKRAQASESLALQVGNRVSSSNAKVPNQKTSKRLSVNAASMKGNNVVPCVLCSKDHYLWQCQAFLDLKPKDRQSAVNGKELCGNCLQKGHFAKSCRSRYTCQQCKKKHHTLLHFVEDAKQPCEKGSSDSSIMAAAHVNSVDRVSKNVLLSTVLLEVNDAYGQRHLVRALLDNGSQPNAISESLCQQLHLPRKKVNILIVGVDGIESSANHEVRAKVQSRVTNYSAEMDFLVLRKVACDTPSHEVPVQKWNIPASYPLADPHFCTPGRIDMIIGAGYFYSLLCDGRYSLPNKGVLVESVFGWIMTGDIPAISSDAVRCNVVAVRPTIEEQLERFWKIEELQVSEYSFDEKECERHFQQTVSRDGSGRYIVQMPKQPNFKEIIVKELQSAKTILFHMVQREVFSDDIRAITKGKCLTKSSSIRLLNPFLDSCGLLRVGGRDQHHKTLHGGVTMTLSSLRDEVWILNGMRAVRSVLRTCYRCIRANPVPIAQPIGQLPVSRVTYQLVQRYAQGFWHRWRNEYVKSLNGHRNVKRSIQELNVGDLVIVKDEQLPAVKWPLARIVEKHPGPDSVTRVVTLRTANGIIKRPVSKICALECHQEV
ncbi:uncharacterized protein LOC118507144 [Anopheles stephensi]|uniref:uncharacterized protein LOC118502454 n=2 Tax=Anopheles stephensi TaxID=30069 RepID=UPI0016588F50|nr:uncharacterized protein LOC118502454 [Anopheles stephensi]XP_035901073.1 uncharacterized protein LOC118507144 [Anopheles stephensi]